MVTASKIHYNVSIDRDGQYRRYIIGDTLSPILYYRISLSIIEIIKASIYVSIKDKIVSNIGIYYNRVLD